MIRPWTPDQADGLPPDERVALDFLEEHDRQGSGYASHRILVGMALNLLEAREAYTKLGLADMDQVCKAFFSIGVLQGRKYQEAARIFTLEMVGHTRHSLSGLLEIGEASTVYRQELLERGSGRRVEDLHEARLAAEACDDPEAGLAALVAKLAEKKTPLEVEFRRIGKVGPRVVRRARRLTDLVEGGDELKEELRRKLAEDVEGWIKVLSVLVVVLRRPPAEDAAAEDDTDDRADDSDDRADDSDDRTDLRGCVCGFVETKSEQSVETEDRPRQTTPRPPIKADSDDRAADSDDRAADSDDRAADSDDRADLRGCEFSFVKTESTQPVESELRPCQTTPGSPISPISTPDKAQSGLPADVAPLEPVISALRSGLSKTDWRAFNGILHSVAIDEPLDELVEPLRDLLAKCDWGGEPPRALLQYIEQRLFDRVLEDRGRFAVRCLHVGGDEEARSWLAHLTEVVLPAPVKSEALWWSGQDRPGSGRRGPLH